MLWIGIAVLKSRKPTESGQTSFNHYVFSDNAELICRASSVFGKPFKTFWGISST